MTRHVRRSRVPFGAVVVGLAFTIAGLAVAATADRGGDPQVVRAGSKAGQVPIAIASPTPEVRRGTVVIHATGDVSLDPSYIPAFTSQGYGWAWSGLDGLFRHDDLTIVNHECPSTTLVAPVPKTFSFRCDPAALDAAARAGVDVLSFANNHAFDQGPQGLVDSLRNARRAGLLAIGAGTNQDDADAPRYVEVNGWRIGLVGVDEVLDPIDEVAVGHEPGTAVGHDFSRALAAVREADANADLVLVMIHWGVELDARPRAYQVVEARRMIDAGADAIFGGHSHRLQPVDTYRGRPIFYSLGNFVWPRLSVEGSTTGVAEVVVRPDGTIRGRLLPAYIGADGHPVLR